MQNYAYSSNLNDLVSYDSRRSFDQNKGNMHYLSPLDGVTHKRLELLVGRFSQEHILKVFILVLYDTATRLLHGLEFFEQI